MHSAKGGVWEELRHMFVNVCVCGLVGWLGGRMDVIHEITKKKILGDFIHPSSYPTNQPAPEMTKTINISALKVY